MTEMKGTPITRGGGFLVRVGWGAVAYSVDRSLESRYRRNRALLLMLAVVVGVAVAIGSSFVLFTFIAPLAKKVGVNFAHYPEFWTLVIYGLTFVFGGLVYLHILSGMGKKMMAKFQPFDEGRSLVEQRRKAAFTGIFTQILLIALMAGAFLAPIEVGQGLRLFLVALLGAFTLEGIFFRFISPTGKSK